MVQSIIQQWNRRHVTEARSSKLITPYTQKPTPEWKPQTADGEQSACVLLCARNTVAGVLLLFLRRLRLTCLRARDLDLIVEFQTPRLVRISITIGPFNCHFTHTIQTAWSIADQLDWKQGWSMCRYYERGSTFYYFVILRQRNPTPLATAAVIRPGSCRRTRACVASPPRYDSVLSKRTA